MDTRMAQESENSQAPGWIQIPDKIDVDATNVITADLGRRDVQELTRLLRAVAIKLNQSK